METGGNNDVKPFGFMFLTSTHTRHIRVLLYKLLVMLDLAYYQNSTLEYLKNSLKYRFFTISLITSHVVTEFWLPTPSTHNKNVAPYHIGYAYPPQLVPDISKWRKQMRKISFLFDLDKKL